MSDKKVMKEGLVAPAPEATPEYVYEQIQTKHGTFTTTVPEKYKAQQKWERPNPNRILSFIPGTITEIAVKAGDEVKKGDKLLMFNAMKMANTLNAPFDGKIKAIDVEIGQVVANGALLLEFED